MRELVLQRLKELTENASPGQMRWERFFRKLFVLQGGDPDTKKGKKEFRSMTIADFSFESQSDAVLFDLFENACRQFYAGY